MLKKYFHIFYVFIVKVVNYTQVKLNFICFTGICCALLFFMVEVNLILVADIFVLICCINFSVKLLTPITRV